jgi:hypothetical protein
MITELDHLIRKLEGKQRVQAVAIPLVLLLEQAAPFVISAAVAALTSIGLVSAANKLGAYSPGRSLALTPEEENDIRWALIEKMGMENQAGLATFDAADLGLSFAEGDNGPASMPVPKVPDITKEEALAELEAALADAEARGDEDAAYGLRKVIIVVRANGLGDLQAMEVSHLNRRTGAGIPDVFLQYAQQFVGDIASEAQETAAGITMAAENIESILSYNKIPDPKERCQALHVNMRQMIDALHMSKIAFKVSWFSAKSEAILVRAAKYVDDWCSGLYGPGPMTN